MFALRDDNYVQQTPSSPQVIDDFDFGNIDKSREQRLEDEKRQNTAKAKWSNWQKKLDSAYNKALEYDKDKYVSASEKAQMWKRLADSFSQDNPHSPTDQLIRTKAKERLNYWKNYKAPKPEVKKPPVATWKEQDYEKSYTKTPRVSFRTSYRKLGKDDVKSMLKKYMLFDKYKK